jgi:predicted metal-dependent hydrolase
MAQDDRKMAPHHLPGTTCCAQDEVTMTTTPHVLPEVRNLKFAFDSEIPRDWHGGRQTITSFFNNLSVFFPAGEKFFIVSVKAHKQFITEPRLAEEARNFYSQEGIHSREHIRYNAVLKSQGYPVEAMEKRVDRLLRRVAWLIPVRKQLAVTSALEHFTALMAHLMLRDAKVLEGAHPVMAGLWRWHAAEENEHKAVAFDVYKAAGGTYIERCIVMVFATVIFWAKVFEHQVRLMHHDGTLFSWGEWRSLLSFLFVSPGAFRGLGALYFDYFRPSFHPWDLDNRDLLDSWKRELEASPAYTG